MCGVKAAGSRTWGLRRGGARSDGESRWLAGSCSPAWAEVRGCFAVEESASPLLLIKATHIPPRSLAGVHYCTSPKSSLDTLNITGRPLGEQRVGGRGWWGGLVDARGRAGADHTWTSELKVPSCGIPQLSRWVVSNRLQLGIHSRNNKWDDPCPR